MVRDDRESERTAESLGGRVRRQYKRGIVAGLSKERHCRERNACAPPTARELVSADWRVQAIATLRSSHRRRIAGGLSLRFRPRCILCSTGHSVGRVRKFRILRVTINRRNAVKWIKNV